jgi:predicted O-methyltransferase YrrM
MGMISSGIANVDRYVAQGYDEVKGMSSRIAATICGHLLRRQSEAGITGAIAEIGAFEGRFFIALALALRSGETAVAIDLFTWPSPAVLDRFEAHLGRFGVDRTAVAIIKGDSADLTPDDIADASGGPVRFFHIDGEHSRAALTRDLDLALATLHPEGVICLDDMLHPGYPLLAVAVHDWLARNQEMRVFCIVDREDIVAAAKFLICRDEMFEFYQRDLMTSFPSLHYVPGAVFEDWLCLVLTPQPRMAQVE